MIPFRKNNSIVRKGGELESIFDNFFNDDFFLSRNASSFGNGSKVDLKEDENKIQAVFTDGVLKITLPKADPEKNKMKKIDIH